MKLCIDKILVDHFLVQTNSCAGTVFWTTVGSPAVFKEELSALRGCLYKHRSKCVAQMGALNTAGPLIEGYAVRAQTVNE